MSYSLKIITPQGSAFESAAIEYAEVPGEAGSFGVLDGHAPLLASSAGGSLSVRERGGKTRVFQVGSGFFEVRKNQAVFLTETFSEQK